MVALVEPILKAVFSNTPKKIAISVATLQPNECATCNKTPPTRMLVD